jgi:hypothetical protein
MTAASSTRPAGGSFKQQSSLSHLGYCCSGTRGRQRNYTDILNLHNGIIFIARIREIRLRRIIVSVVTSVVIQLK